MISTLEIKLLKDFGFTSYAHFQKSLTIPPKGRYRIYHFKWRLTMMSKYKPVHSPIKNSVITFFTQYEDYVIKNQKGSLANWPKNAKDQSEYLFERLVTPWKLIKHGSLLFSIKDPKNTLWFRALDLQELFKALDICYKESKKSGAKVKPWTLSLKWNECVATYKQKRKRGILWVGKDYDVALMLCDNIISTWDTKTGNWKPWNNAWSRLAHQKLSGIIKYGYIATPKNQGLISDSIMKGLSAIPGTQKKEARFDDVSNFVFKEGLSGMKQAAFIIATAFAVGGSRAAKIINGFHEQHGIPKWWKR